MHTLPWHPLSNTRTLLQTRCESHTYTNTPTFLKASIFVSALKISAAAERRCSTSGSSVSCRLIQPVTRFPQIRTNQNRVQILDCWSHRGESQKQESNHCFKVYVSPESWMKLNKLWRQQAARCMKSICAAGSPAVPDKAFYLTQAHVSSSMKGFEACTCTIKA